MSKEVTIDEIKKHKSNAIKSLQSTIDQFANVDISKANKFCYWLEDYSKFLNYEKNFTPKKLIRYKRGEIIKAHLGFNIGSEEGGLHYCIVLDKNNKLSSPVLTVIPLTSVKDTNKKLRTGEIYIGNEIYVAIRDKINKNYEWISNEINILENKQKNSETVSKDDINYIRKRLEEALHMQDEFNAMKQGSIALIGQITTISKIRIYTPKAKYDTLSNIKVSSTTLDKIDNEIKKLFMK